jgi:hypothetical protein
VDAPASQRTHNISLKLTPEVLFWLVGGPVAGVRFPLVIRRGRLGRHWNAGYSGCWAIPVQDVQPVLSIVRCHLQTRPLRDAFGSGHLAARLPSLAWRSTQAKGDGRLNAGRHKRWTPQASAGSSIHASANHWNDRPNCRGRAPKGWKPHTRRHRALSEPAQAIRPTAPW